MTNETLQKLIFKTASFSAKVISTLLVLNSLSIMYNSLITKTGEEFTILAIISVICHLGSQDKSRRTYNRFYCSVCKNNLNVVNI